MDYEKAYKESFGVAQCLHEAGDTTTKKQMERLFPQLAESDDYRNWKKVKRAIRIFFTNPTESNELLAWLEKQKEQKPVKWSEEDSRMLSDIAGYISGVGSSSGITKRERVDFLYELPKRFNLQPKPEWSEEDEKMLEGTLMWLDDLEKQGEYVEKERLWLKSIRPVSKESLQSWKPSEEQMKILAMFTNLRCASRREANTLESLYNDLKKLM